MTTNISMYDLNLQSCVDLIAAIGHQRSVLAEGHIGTGKSSMLPMLGERFPEHQLVYFDCTTKDMGDIMIPNVSAIDGKEFVQFVPNEEFGIHLNKPVILMIDEIGKANRGVQNALTRTFLERYVGNQPLPKGSIVFATSNLSTEGVGDTLPAHTDNRVMRVRIRKSTNMEWIEWGLNNSIDPTVLSWVKDNPQLFQSFEEVSDPSDNPYIFHPRDKRRGFVTARSLHAASDLVKVRNGVDTDTIQAGLIGTVGARAASDLMAFVRLADQIPSIDDIKNSPETAAVPNSSAAVCLVVYRTLSALEPDWINPWMTYLDRLDVEAQGLFINNARIEKYKHRDALMTNSMFTKWALANSYLYSADTK